MSIKTLKEIPKKGVAVAETPPALEAEPPHRRLAKLVSEQVRLIEELQSHKTAWAHHNFEAQRIHQPPSSAEQTAYKQHHRDLSCRLAEINLQIGQTNKVIRQHKAEVQLRKSKPRETNGDAERSATPRHGLLKTCPLKSHPAWDQYFRLACENQLAPGLLASIEKEAKGLLSQSLQTGIEQ
jgi:hypothetical protein